MENHILVIKAEIIWSKTIKFLFLFLASNQKKCLRRRKIKRKLELVFSSKNRASSNFNIEKEMSDDPEAATDLLDVLDDSLDSSDKKKKKTLKDGGVSIFRGEDLFGNNTTNESKDDLPPPPPPPRPSKVTKAKHTLVGNS